MRSSSYCLLLGGFALAASALACDSTGPLLPPPQNLSYVLDPSGIEAGDPPQPAGVLLEWDSVDDPALEVYNVYSSLDGATFDLRASTTSLSYHDVGLPDLEYFVVSVNLNGEEGPQSEILAIDERLRLEAPTSLTSTSLDGAIHLAWADNAFINDPEGFRRYRVYGTDYDLDNNVCLEGWSVEGTTVSPEFVSSALANGSPLCFGITSESVEGWESTVSPIRADTPRPDARNVLVFRDGADITQSGFRFFQDLNADGFVDPSELGIVTRGDLPSVDFHVIDQGGSLVMQPVRVGTGVALYDPNPIEDLTSIDIAPVMGFSPVGIQASAGFGYVFEMDGGDGFARFGGLRVTHVSADFIIFDWSYQTDPGNPELLRHGGRPTARERKLRVVGVK